MKTTRKFLVAFLIVIGATAYAHTSTDSVKFKVKVLPSLESKSFRLFYESGSSERVSVKVYDSNHAMIFTKSYEAATFVQPFDLSKLPDDTYTFKVKTSEGEYTEKVVSKAKQLSMPTIDFSAEMNNRIARLQSTTPLGSSMRLLIYDSEGEILHREDLAANTSLDKMYDLKNVQAKGVSFLIYQNGKLVDEKTVKF